MAFSPGEPVRIEMTKWGDRPHWHIPGHWLGSDDQGDWIGIRAGSRMVRPGRDVRSEYDQVGLVPGDGDEVQRGFLATFHRAPSHVWVYVDMTTPPVWDGATLRAVDLDLDVVCGREGDVVVDDEDEFAEHQVAYGYPAEIIALAEASRDRVRDAILAEHAPYDGRHEAWFAHLADLPHPG
ncbi:DUF402 domain-containing protein [Nocardioides cynanchi]|uniref:DUF402 domain-containing protein n=1 Tax=Nocardioides cynanchi TaxID=2558918 RepID=UPI001249344B|nr:DUF402 domain-containing protein [Nocardioides cynanchi]